MFATQPSRTDSILVAPADSSVIVLPVVLQWQSGGWMQYLVEVDDDGDFSSPVVQKLLDGDATSLTVNAPSLQQGKRYYWRVGGVGFVMAWSEIGSFIVAPPPPPDQDTPPDGANVTVTPTLNWSAVWSNLPPAPQYQVQVASDSGFTSIVEDSGWLDTTAYAVSPGALVVEATYHWRVRARVQVKNFWGEYVEGDWSVHRSFSTTVVTTPGVMLTVPADSALDVAQPVSLRWDLMSGSPVADGFQYEVARDEAFQDVAQNGEVGGGVRQAAVTGLEHGRRYYWHVRGFVNVNGSRRYGAWAGPRHFTTLPLPGQPHLQSPGPGVTGEPVDPVLTWFAAPRASRYILHLARSVEELDQPNRRIYTVGESTPHWTTFFAVSQTDARLDYQTRYYWRVKAVNAAGESAWSPVWSFRTGAGFSGPVNLKPADGKTSLNSPKTFNWDKPVGPPKPDYYELHFAYDRDFNNEWVDVANTSSYPYVHSLRGKTWHYWRVRGRYNNGNYTEWSDTLRFRTRPDAPVRRAPGVNARMVPLPATLQWDPPVDPTDYGNAYHYQVEIYEGADLTTPLLTFDPWTQTSLTLDQPAVHYDQCYHWRLRVVSDDAQAPEPASFWSGNNRTVCFNQYVQPAHVWPFNGSTVYGNGRFSVLWEPLLQGDLPPFGVFPTHYDVQVGDAPNLDDPSHVVFSDEVRIPVPNLPPQPSVGLFLPGILANNATYYWRVRARNNDDGIGPWSAPWHFLVNPEIGSPPSLVSPVDHALNQSRQPTLRWRLAPNASRHIVYVMRNGEAVWQKDNYTQGLPGNDTSQQVETLLDYETTYTWKVYAYSPTMGVWSQEEWQFTTAPEQTLGPPGLIYPAAAAQNLSLPVDLQWSLVAGASGYHLQVSEDDPTFTQLLVDDPNVTVTRYALTTLQEGTSYYWRLCTQNTSGTCGGWSEVRTFVTTGAVALDAPTLLLPDPNGTAPVPVQPLFQWEPVNGATAYEWQLGDANGFGAPLARVPDLAQTSYLHDHALNEGQTYTWRVRALDALGRVGPWSMVAGFTTERGAGPGVPGLEAPEDGTTGHPATVILAWTPVTGATRYHVQVVDDPSKFVGGPYVVDADQVPFSEVTYTVNGLAEGQWYHWRVQACNGAICSGWPQAWRFLVGFAGATGARRFYYLKDYLGSVRATVDEDGAVVHYDDYYPFGAPLPNRSSVTQQEGDPIGKPRFTGHEREWEVDDAYYYAGARYYDGLIGRWNAVDPLADDYAGWSPYNYVFGNPLMLVDPSGECPEDYEGDCLEWWKQEYASYLRTVGSHFAFRNPVTVVKETVSSVRAFLSDPSGTVKAVASNIKATVESALEGDPEAVGKVAGHTMIAAAEALATKGLSEIASGTDVVANAVPNRLARIVPAEFADTPTLGSPGAADVFVTAADDITGITTSQGLAQTLTLVDDSGNLLLGPHAVIEFDAPATGIASPVFRNNPGFVGFGRTAGGAREFVMPNLLISRLYNVRRRIAK